MRLGLLLFGPFQATWDGQPVTIAASAARALLAYLALEADRPHQRELLAALLWPDQPQAAAYANLRQALARVRKSLPDTPDALALLEITPQTLQFKRAAAAIDVTRFEELLAACAAHAHADLASCAACAARLTEATALYRGDLLHGLFLAQPFEEWLLLKREQLQRQALAALDTLADHHLGAGRFTEASDAARRQIALSPWHEAAHRHLMRALAAAGDRAAALMAFERCRQTLWDELGVEPDTETLALAAQIRTAEAAPHAAPATLPTPLTALVGRADELARIGGLLRADDQRLVTIVGAGGAGKTRLALAAAWALRDAFADGVGWVPLAGVTAAGLPLQHDALAAAVGVAIGRPFGGRGAPLDELRDELRERAMLLVLDNCEHLPIAAPFVRQLLEAAPRLSVLATSRVLLDIAGEVPLRLDGLPVPERGADDPASYAAVQLFLERARRQARDFDESEANLRAAAQLCRLLDGLPLAIELAARWVGHYSCDEIAAEIQADLNFLTVPSGDVPERQRGLRAAFDYSWRLLAPAERLALARLSVFRGTFDRAAAQAVAATRVTTLAALADASLLRSLGIGRYGFHELVRQFAAARLAESGEMETLAERHAAYYLTLLADQETALYGDAPQAAAAVIRDAADNLRQAWIWAIEHGAWDGIAGSLPALRQYTWIDGLFYENAARVAEAAEQIGAQIAQGQATPEQMALLGRLRGTEASFLERQEARTAAAASARAAIASAEAAGDVLGEAYGYLQLSTATVPYIALLAPRETAPAIGWLERAIALCRSARDLARRSRRFATEVEAACLLKLSTIRIDLREYAEACALGEQALALTRMSGDRLHEARALSFSAMALENAGRYQAAYERRMTMLNLARANGSRLQEQLALNNLSCTLIYLGDYPAALEHAQAALRISGEWMQNPYHATEFHHTLSWAACRAGETELALEIARKALAFAQASGAPQNQPLPLLALGDALHDLGRYDESHSAYTAALALGRERQTLQPVAVALAGIARCRLAEGAYADAQVAADEMLHGQDILTLGSLWEPLRVAEICYRVLQANGDGRADEVLHAAAMLLEWQANGIADRERRHVFREQVAAHRAILAAVANEVPCATSDTSTSQTSAVTAAQSYDWDAAPEIATLYGRAPELARLERWIAADRCRVVALLGIGGVGKTTLAAAAVKAVAARFDIVIWRSLLNAPPLDELLRGMLQRLSSQQLTDMPAGLDALLALLVNYLRQQRCLLVLDNLESILQPDQPGQFRPGYDGYAQLIQCLAEPNHSSCLLLTSRERPRGMARREEDTPLVRTLPLDGLDATAGRAMITARGLIGTDVDSTALVERYSGNPLALKLVAQTVEDLFGSDIAAFLAAEAPIFDDIRIVLDQQFTRLSDLEQEILIWLAIERVPISIQALRENLVSAGLPRAFLEALRGLQRRSLIEQNAQGWTLQNVVTEYLTDVLISQVCREITGEPENRRLADWGNEAASSPSPRHPVAPSALNRYALLKATAKEYVRASQMRLIMEPIAQQLVAALGRARVVAQLKQIIAGRRESADMAPGYAAGNILNLLLHLQIDLRGYDFSRLDVRQAYVQGAQLPDVNFRDANLSHSVFTHIFGEILAIHFDVEQQLLVAGVSDGKLCLWRAADGRLHENQTLDADATIAAFSSDGRIIVTGDTDHQVRVWDVAHGRRLHSLSGHTETPWALTFSPDGTTLASSGADGVVHVWDVPTGQLRQTLRGHTSAVPALAFTNDGQMLASGDVGGTICIWHVGTPEPVYTLHGHTDEVHALVFDTTGTILASGSHDRTVGLWDVGSGRLVHTLKAHTEVIRTLAISPDGRTLSSGGGDMFVCLWDVRSGQALHTLLDLTHRNNFLSFSANGRTLATVGGDQTVDLWDVVTGRRLDSLQAYSNAIYSIDFSPNGELLVSGGTDNILRLWDVSTVRPGPSAPFDTAAPLPFDPAQGSSRVEGQGSSSGDTSGQASLSTRVGTHEPTARIFQGHTNWIFSVAYSPDGAILASAGRDHTIRMWDMHSGRAIRTLHGHTDDLEAIQFSPDGQRLLSASRDTTLRVWDVQSGQTIDILQGHTERIHSCAFSPDGQLVASGSIDRTVRLWDVRPRGRGHVLHTLSGHINAVRCVAFNADGRILASSGFDQLVQLWDTQSGQLMFSLPAQDTITTSIAFHPNGALLATGAKDHSVRLWGIAPTSAPGGRLPQPWSLGAVRLRATLRGHTNSVESVRFSPDGCWVASGSTDETIKLWDVATGACLQTLRSDGPYANMNITGVTGISEAQKAALKALGAVETC